MKDDRIHFTEYLTARDIWYKHASGVSFLHFIDVSTSQLQSEKNGMYHVPAETARRIRMLLSPNAKAIIAVWLAKHTS